ncbi:hypothetical protein [Streptomyces sp. ST1015]|uniref:hypothetical protein n=1 Tax=Streptomyces sp. ST1015 TaxID=1848900 RepID=UPI00223C22F9|nr:hypothetical protein [Streptomyces sp. ST1015]
MHGERPFHEELRAAIAASGLSLDRIHERLRLRGVPVSAATLSSWQSGRHQPERRRSLSALAVLEDVLSLPPASLSARLAPPGRVAGGCRQATGSPHSIGPGRSGTRGTPSTSGGTPR